MGESRRDLTTSSQLTHLDVPGMPDYSYGMHPERIA